MRELREVERLRKQGVRIDAYLNDCYWFAPDGGYRTFRQPHWPAGPDRWLAECRRLGILPGLWVATNNMWKGFDLIPEWKASYDPRRKSLCMFDGGYLAHFCASLQIWYDRGVRLFKFDFADMNAATPAAEQSWTPPEIRAMNATALRAALASFRSRNPEVRFLAYNGFGGVMDDTATPIRKTVDLKWLEVFDSMYCGDPRPSDVPAVNFWRSNDIYSDHMVRYFRDNAVPLERIDNSAFMIGTTGTCLGRRTSAWKGMLLLSLARGGWMNTYYGNLELLEDADAGWFARAQSVYLPIQQRGRTSLFGAIPGSGQPYGYAGRTLSGDLYTVVNRSQAVAEIPLPQATSNAARHLLFADAGFVPKLSPESILLGPEQMAVIGAGELAAERFELGLQADVLIPTTIERLQSMTVEGNGSDRLVVEVPRGRDLRIIARQTRPDGVPLRSSGGAPPGGHPLGRF